MFAQTLLEYCYFVVTLSKSLLKLVLLRPTRQPSAFLTFCISLIFICSSFSSARSRGFSLLSSDFKLTSFIPSFHEICLIEDFPPELRVDIFGNDVAMLTLLPTSAAVYDLRLYVASGSIATIFGFSFLFLNGDFGIKGFLGIKFCYVYFIVVFVPSGLERGISGLSALPLGIAVAGLY